MLRGFAVPQGSLNEEARAAAGQRVAPSFAGAAEEPPPPAKRMARQLAKTQICKHYSRGFCRYGDKCAYAHEMEELVPRPNLQKTKMCIAFLSGSCSKDNCSYAHGLKELRAPGRTVTRLPSMCSPPDSQVPSEASLPPYHWESSHSAPRMLNSMGDADDGMLSSAASAAGAASAGMLHRRQTSSAAMQLQHGRPERLDRQGLGPGSPPSLEQEGRDVAFQQLREHHHREQLRQQQRRLLEQQPPFPQQQAHASSRQGLPLSMPAGRQSAHVQDPEMNEVEYWRLREDPEMNEVEYRPYRSSPAFRSEMESSHDMVPDTELYHATQRPFVPDPRMAPHWPAAGQNTSFGGGEAAPEAPSPPPPGPGAAGQRDDVVQKVQEAVIQAASQAAREVLRQMMPVLQASEQQRVLGRYHVQERAPVAGQMAPVPDMAPEPHREFSSGWRGALGP